MTGRSMTRRRLLGGSAALAGLFATGGCLDSITGGGGNESIELGGQTDGWQGQAPGDIEGETNPTLSLESGTTYDLTWENLDGQEHELIIEDADGNELEASDSSEEQGATVTLTFEASEEMAQYYCEYHPDRMRGDITTEG